MYNRTVNFLRSVEETACNASVKWFNVLCTVVHCNTSKRVSPYLGTHGVYRSVPVRRYTLFQVLKEEEWSEDETERVHKLCGKWFCPVPTRETNKLLLYQQLLYHAVCICIQVLLVKTYLLKLHLRSNIAFLPAEFTPKTCWTWKVVTYNGISLHHLIINVI